ncbi:hypothetical protein [Nevskia sp.]|uniref:hypothetical protein n=1 Tax=Nevskia sp. TaxID=1929292 RepID=UPI0025D83DC3|nr:hypothetical protein [Nevskia sp.]
MARIARKLALHPGLILGGVVVLGMLEFVALQRSQRASRRRKPEALAQQAA